MCLRDAKVGYLRVLAVIPGQDAGQNFIFARRQVNQLRTLGMNVETFFLRTRTHPVGMVREAFRFRSHVRTFRPHAVHAHYGTITALFCVLLARCPVVITFRGTDLNPSAEFSWLRASVSRVASQLAALLATELVCVSEELRRRLWWRVSATHVIPSGVNLEEFRPLDRSAARRSLGWSDLERVVLFNEGAGRPPNKRRDLVEQASTLAGEHLGPLRLVVLAGEVGAADLPLYLNAADAVVMASDYEGSPNIVKESLACNTPVCSVRVGDVTEMLRGVSGCVLVDRTPKDIANGLVELLRQPRRSNGREFSERFSAELTTQQLYRVLEGACGASVTHECA